MRGNKHGCFLGAKKNKLCSVDFWSWVCFIIEDCWQSSLNTTEPVKTQNRKMFSFLTSFKCSIPSTDLKGSLWIIIIIFWDKTQQTQSNTDAANVTWSVSSCCFLDVKKEKSYRWETWLFPVCFMCEWLPVPEFDSNFQTRSQTNKQKAFFERAYLWPSLEPLQLNWFPSPMLPRTVQPAEGCTLSDQKRLTAARFKPSLEKKTTCHGARNGRWAQMRGCGGEEALPLFDTASAQRFFLL